MHPILRWFNPISHFYYFNILFFHLRLDFPSGYPTKNFVLIITLCVLQFPLISSPLESKSINYKTHHLGPDVLNTLFSKKPNLCYSFSGISNVVRPIKQDTLPQPDRLWDPRLGLFPRGLGGQSVQLSRG